MDRASTHLYTRSGPEHDAARPSLSYTASERLLPLLLLLRRCCRLAAALRLPAPLLLLLRTSLLLLPALAVDGGHAQGVLYRGLERAVAGLHVRDDAADELVRVLRKFLPQLSAHLRKSIYAHLNTIKQRPCHLMPACRLAWCSPISMKARHGALHEYKQRWTSCCQSGTVNGIAICASMSSQQRPLSKPTARPC